MYLIQVSFLEFHKLCSILSEGMAMSSTQSTTMTPDVVHIRHSTSRGDSYLSDGVPVTPRRHCFVQSWS